MLKRRPIFGRGRAGWRAGGGHFRPDALVCRSSERPPRFGNMVDGSMTSGRRRAAGASSRRATIAQAFAAVQIPCLAVRPRPNGRRSPEKGRSQEARQHRAAAEFIGLECGGAFCTARFSRLAIPLLKRSSELFDKKRLPSPQLLI